MAVAIGVHGHVKIPGALGVPEKEVPKIYLIVATLVVSEREGEEARCDSEQCYHCT